MDSEHNWALRCVERLRSTFTLENVYSFEAELAAKHPKNRSIGPKIRQQLQAPGDLGPVEFVAPGLRRRLRKGGRVKCRGSDYGCCLLANRERRVG